MAQPTAVILVVGLNEALLRRPAPRLQRLRAAGRMCRLRPVLPAVTCSVQSSMLTGVAPREHGIVGNGWYDRGLAEVQFWKQSNRMVQAEKVWETARRRDAAVTCANLLWWYNMYSSADFSVTPRPIYKADGRKIPDVYSHPSDLRPRLQAELGRFPLFHFWGPGASIASTRWIAQAAVRVHRWHRPTLTLVYLPHLDYALQKFGPEHLAAAEAMAEVDAEVGRLLDYFEGAGVRPMVVSEYGIEAVDDAVAVNRHLRYAGWLAVREEQGLELLDAGASRAFAVADHQVAHIYVRDPADLPAVHELCAGIPGVGQALGDAGKAAAGIDHARAGDVVLVAAPGKWFSYYYWLDDARAPDFARCVDIHRKPGYDPCELLLDPALRAPKLRIARRLLQKSLGFRMLMDVIPLDAGLVRGSHGRVDLPAQQQPVMITTADYANGAEEIPCTQVRDVILDHLFP